MAKQDREWIFMALRLKAFMVVNNKYTYEISKAVASIFTALDPL
jgi:hypothetical protein